MDWSGSARNVGDAVGNVGNQGSSVGNWGNEGNQGENLCIGVEMMNKKCREG